MTRLLWHANPRCAPSPSVAPKCIRTPLESKASPDFFRCYQRQKPSIKPSTASDSSCLKLFRRLNTHSLPASAPNAGRFLQTSLSEVTRRSRFRHAPALMRRVTPDRVIASGRSDLPNRIQARIGLANALPVSDLNGATSGVQSDSN
jgi:hypothetical protein